MKIELTKCSKCGHVQMHIRGRHWICASCGSREGVYLTTRGMYREALQSRLQGSHGRASVEATR